MKEQGVKILDPNHEYETSVFKFLQLPFGINEECVVAHFGKIGIKQKDIAKINYEKCKEPDMAHIFSVIFSVTVKNSDILMTRKNDLVGNHTIDGEAAFIFKVGDPILCKYCSNFGHIKCDCEILKNKLSKFCETCKQRGHSTDEHIIAAMIADKNIENTPPEQELDREGAGILFDQVKVSNLTSAKDLDNVFQQIQ